VNRAVRLSVLGRMTGTTTTGRSRRTEFPPVLVRLILVLVLVVGAIVTEPAAGNAAGGARQSTLVRPSLFGMHVSDPAAWPTVPVGAVRLWDTGTTWKDIETEPGTYDFTRLDAYVAVARAHRSRVTLVLGQTPAFHVAAGAALPRGQELMGAGATRIPEPHAWRAYVRAVARRYAGQIEALQVWNEGNVPGFWSGTPRGLARLTSIARAVVGDVNRARATHLRLVAPSFVARTNTGPMDRYWQQRIGGRSMNSLVDAVALSLYPVTHGGPESGVARLAYLRRAILDVRRVTKPVWTTEVNYGMVKGGSTEPVVELSPARQAAFVARTYLLQGAADVRRIFWYGWSQRGNVAVVLSTGGEVTAAGLAFQQVQRWMSGSRLAGCRTVATGERRGLVICTLRDGRGLKRVFWHPTKRLRVRLGVDASSTVDLQGLQSTASGRTLVDFRPLLVRYRR
jgi:polysaccharide biosynthesis protein PslG